jgi:hypothetical protein
VPFVASTDAQVRRELDQSGSSTSSLQAAGNHVGLKITCATKSPLPARRDETTRCGKMPKIPRRILDTLLRSPRNSRLFQGRSFGHLAPSAAAGYDHATA